MRFKLEASVEFDADDLESALAALEDYFACAVAGEKHELEYMGEIKGPLLDAACGFGNPYLDKLRLNKMIGMDIDPTVKDRNRFLTILI